MIKISKTLTYIIAILIFLPFFLITTFSSLVYLYEKRSVILIKLGYKAGEGHHSEKRFLINPLKQSKRPIPPLDIKNLEINNDSDVADNGQLQ